MRQRDPQPDGLIEFQVGDYEPAGDVLDCLADLLLDLVEQPQESKLSNEKSPVCNLQTGP